MRHLRLLIVVFTIGFSGYAQNILFIPDTLSGQNINMTLQPGTTQFYNGQITNTLGANGNILGPTLILNRGEMVNLSVQNQLPDTTTIHWHGMHVSSENDGGPHTYILPNSTWSPSFTVLDNAATYWYHPHLHKRTNEHVSKGIAGLIIVRDSLESNLVLPRTYGIDDIPLVIQTKDFDASNQIVVHSNNDDVVMVNATLDAYVDLPAQIIRLRVLNGSSQRTFNLGLTNNKSFYQIASDGGLLSNPVLSNRLMLAPGERAELLVDLTNMIGQTVYLRSYASEMPNGIYGATNPGMMAMMTLNGYNPNPINGTDFDILEINVVNQTANAVTTVPQSLVTISPLDPAAANATRNLTFSPSAMGPNQLNGKFLINNSSFDMSIVNYSIPLGDVEIWQLFNQSGMAHPFHIHDVQFQILTRNGSTPAAGEQGWKDVVLVKPMENVSFIARFADFANDSIPYMYHCHMLSHEDDGMMGQFVVTNPLSTKGPSRKIGFMVYPNPNEGTFKILFDRVRHIEYQITDVSGRILVLDTIISDEITISHNLRSGSYLVWLKDRDDGSQAVDQIMIH